MKLRFCAVPFTLLALLSYPLLSNTLLAQSRWLPFGPDGGDARAFAPDPSDHNHIYLGTVTGTIFDTHDGGESWTRVGRVGKRDDLVLDNIVVDPSNAKHVLVGGWVLDHPDGGLYITNDGGKTWASNPQMNGHSIRSLTIAPSDPKTLVLGALDGVYRSSDGGNKWVLISPLGSTEIHEVESVAIDPGDPRIIYAGTWHLPWKTTDGGANWTNMKEGIIDDSDVFSIIVNPRDDKDIFLSACSGIYRSTNQGDNFIKVQGIPSTARRTRVLMQDSGHTETVFAGTTEGLWKTTDSGHTFLRNGDPGWVINDVNIDPNNSQRILLATDRTGVLISNDGGVTFTPSNRGFSSRQISTITQDRTNPARMWVGILNDKTAGGVFGSENGGISWFQKSWGLNGADVFSLAQAPDGTLLAGTRHGIYRYIDASWQTATAPLATLQDDTPKKAPTRSSTKAQTTHPVNTAAARAARAKQTARTTRKSASVTTAPDRAAPPQEATTGVYSLVSTDTAVFAATEQGLLFSIDSGQTWSQVATTQGKPWHLLAAQGLRLFAADQHRLALSVDHGLTFMPIAAPPDLTYLTAITIDGGGRLWAGGPQGVFYSDNDGTTWKGLTGLFVPAVSGLYFDRVGSRVLLTANQPSTIVYSVHTPDLKVTYNDSGWTLRAVRPVGDYMVGLTPYDGIVIQPKMVVSEMGPLHETNVAP